MLQKGSQALLKLNLKQAISSSKPKSASVKGQGLRIFQNLKRNTKPQSKADVEPMKKGVTESSGKAPDEAGGVALLLTSPVELQRAVKTLQKSSLVAKQATEHKQTLWIRDLV